IEIDTNGVVYARFAKPFVALMPEDLMAELEDTEDPDRHFAGRGSKESLLVALMRRRSQSTGKRVIAIPDKADDAFAGTRDASELRRRMPRLDDERVDLAEAAYSEGLTLEEVASVLGADRRTIGQHLKRRGVQARRQRLTEAQVNEAVVLYE